MYTVKVHHQDGGEEGHTCYHYLDMIEWASTQTYVALRAWQDSEALDPRTVEEDIADLRNHQGIFRYPLTILDR
jgi:hypothetical protein